MLKPKKKISKRELKEDKFIEFTLKARDFVEDNAKWLIRGGIFVLIAIILISFYVRSKRKANVEANQLLGEAQLVQAQGNTKKAEDLLNQLVKDYEGVTAAGQGTYLLAKLYWQQGDTEKAKIYFKKYTDEYSNDDLLTSSALAGYANCLMRQNEVGEAAKNYEKAAEVDKESPQAPSFFYSAALAYMQADNYKKAQEMAQKIIKNYDKSEYKQKAEVLLNMAKDQSKS
jgi:tetratricopeptide (TPR) repeat protein